MNAVATHNITGDHIRAVLKGMEGSTVDTTTTEAIAKAFGEADGELKEFVAEALDYGIKPLVLALIDLGYRLRIAVEEEER